MKRKKIATKIIVLGLIAFTAWMCVPPEVDSSATDRAELARLDSLREVRCPRLMSSAAEYYRNQDWVSTARIYGELVDLGCGKYDPILAPPEELYLYWAIAYEYLGRFDSSEYVLLRGLQALPNNVDLLKRLAYSYKKLNLSDKEIAIYELLIDMLPSNDPVLMDLVKLYGDLDRCDDQIYVLGKILDADPNNEIAQGEMAVALQNCGKDPLEIYRKRFDANPDNIAYGLDYAERLMMADRPDEVVDVLKQVIRTDPSSKLAYRKLGTAYSTIDDLSSASSAFEELFKLDPRDYRIALKISEVNVDLEDFNKAFRWAEKALQLSKNAGDALGQKGNVYYKAFQYCRSSEISDDDRIIASLAYNNFSLAEDNGYRRFVGSKKWLEENEVLFDRTNWFMQDTNQKNKGYVQVRSECYQWVEEKLMKKAEW